MRTEVKAVLDVIAKALEGEATFRIRETEGGTKSWLRDEVFESAAAAQAAMDQLIARTRTTKYAVVEIRERVVTQ